MTNNYSVRRNTDISIMLIFCALVALAGIAKPANAEQIVMDSFSRNVKDGWGKPAFGGNWNFSGQAENYSVSDGKGQLHVVGGDVSRRIIIGKPSVNTEILGSISWDSPPTGNFIYGGLLLRASNDKKNFYYARVKNSNGRASIAIDKFIENKGLVLNKISLPIPFIANQEYNLRFVAAKTNPTLLKAKLWAISQPEPTQWSITVEDNDGSLQVAGLSGVRAGTSKDYVGKVSFLVDNLSVSKGEVDKGDKGDKGVAGKFSNLTYRHLYAQARVVEILYP